MTGGICVGDLVGENEGGDVGNSFWDTETSRLNVSASGTGKDTTEMKDLTTFADAAWNITTVANPSLRDPLYIWNLADDVT